MLKRIARKILRIEIETYEKTIIDMRSDETKLRNAKDHEVLEYMEKVKKALEEKCKTEKENEISRKYYDLDKEPSDEIKTKIHIDLELNRLKEENMKLLTMVRAMQTYYPPVPMYSAIGGFGNGIQSTFRF